MFLAAAAVSLAIAPAQAADGPHTVTRDGATHTYYVSDQGDTRVISGRSAKGDAFRLLVRNGRVKGYFGGRPVTFRVKETIAESYAARAAPPRTADQLQAHVARPQAAEERPGT